MFPAPAAEKLLQTLEKVAHLACQKSQLDSGTFISRALDRPEFPKRKIWDPTSATYSAMHLESKPCLRESADTSSESPLTDDALMHGRSVGLFHFKKRRRVSVGDTFASIGTTKVSHTASPVQASLSHCQEPRPMKQVAQLTDRRLLYVPPKNGSYYVLVAGQLTIYFHCLLQIRRWST
jgi:hypothetical protein